MDDEDENSWVAVPIPGRRFQAADAVVIGFSFLQDIAEAVATAFGYVASVAASHVNFRVEQDAFRQQAAQEIETLIGEDGRDG